MATSTIHATTVGVFHSREAAERAITELKQAGYRDSQIGVVGKNIHGKSVKTNSSGKVEEGATIGAASGAAAGASVMALGSLAVSFGVIPVIGPILAVGPLAAALISAAGGAAGGAAVAGIAGALIGWGVSEEDAQYYEDEVQAGRILVTVDRDDRPDAAMVFTRLGAFDRREMV